MSGVQIANGTRWNHYDAGLLLWSGRERCGFVVEDKGSAAGYCFLEVPNVYAGRQDDFFEIAGEVTAEVFKRFHIVGIWHSHPPGLPQPSSTDVEWHPKAFGDIYIVCDVAIKRYHLINDSLMYQEVSTPWTV